MWGAACHTLYGITRCRIHISVKKGIVHLYNLVAYDLVWSCIHYREGIWNIWKVQWKHTYLIFCFARNGLPPTTNKYCDFNATLTSLVPATASNICRPEQFTWGLHKSKSHNTVKETNFEQQGNLERLRKWLFAHLAGQIRLNLAHQCFCCLPTRVAISISTVCFSLQC